MLTYQRTTRSASLLLPKSLLLLIQLRRSIMSLLQHLLHKQLRALLQLAYRLQTVALNTSHSILHPLLLLHRRLPVVLVPPPILQLRTKLGRKTGLGAQPPSRDQLKAMATLQSIN